MSSQFALQDPTRMPVQGPVKYQGQVAKMDVLDDGTRVGESEDLMSGMSNIALDDQPERFSGFLRQFVKDGTSLESIEMNDTELSGALAGHGLGHSQLEHQTMAFSCPQGRKGTS